MDEHVATAQTRPQRRPWFDVRTFSLFVLGCMFGGVTTACTLLGVWPWSTDRGDGVDFTLIAGGLAVLLLELSVAVRRHSERTLPKGS